MAKGAVVLLVAAAAVVLMASVERAEGAVACSQVTTYLTPCASYILGGGSSPTADCCRGVRNLNSAAKSVSDRQVVCGCIKNDAASYGINLRKAGQVASLCGVKLNVPVSPSTDCSKVR